MCFFGVGREEDAVMLREPFRLPGRNGPVVFENGGRRLSPQSLVDDDLLPSPRCPERGGHEAFGQKRLDATGASRAAGRRLVP